MVDGTVFPVAHVPFTSLASTKSFESQSSAALSCHISAPVARNTVRRSFRPDAACERIRPTHSLILARIGGYCTALRGVCSTSTAIP